MNAIQPLIELQEIDDQIRELEREEKDIPRRQAQERARLAGVNASLASAKEELDALRARIKQAEDDIAERREKVRQMKIKQTSLKTNREYEACSMQITGIEQEIESLIARQIAANDGVPALEARVAEAQKKSDADQGGVDDFCGELAERLSSVKEELESLRARRKEATSAIAPNFLAYYEHIRTKRWPAVAQLNQECVCEGCHLVQPPSVQQMVQRGGTLVACTMCGRVLYRDSEF